MNLMRLSSRPDLEEELLTPAYDLAQIVTPFVFHIPIWSYPTREIMFSKEVE
jgi:hypothetical protein